MSSCSIRSEFVWGFQVVHHDLWDYDVASQPTLFAWKDGTPAVVINTKMGHVFVLNQIGIRLGLPGGASRSVGLRRGISTHAVCLEGWHACRGDQHQDGACLRAQSDRNSFGASRWCITICGITTWHLNPRCLPGRMARLPW